MFCGISKKRVQNSLCGSVCNTLPMVNGKDLINLSKSGSHTTIRSRQGNMLFLFYVFTCSSSIKQSIFLSLQQPLSYCNFDTPRFSRVGFTVSKCVLTPAVTSLDKVTGTHSLEMSAGLQGATECDVAAGGERSVTLQHLKVEWKVMHCSDGQVKGSVKVF